MTEKDLERVKEILDEKIKRVRNGAQWGDKILEERLEHIGEQLNDLKKDLKEVKRLLSDYQGADFRYVKRINIAFVSSFVAMVMSLLVFLVKVVIK